MYEHILNLYRNLTKKRGNTEKYYIIDGQKKNILEESWDILIILDACRFDIFNEVYRNHFSGDVKKAISPATFTTEWLSKTFIDFYDDIIYISTNPYISSKPEYFDENMFIANKHFFKVIDVWDFGWNKQIGSVHPKDVNKAILKTKSKFINKRFIIHYVQPHGPYIGNNYIHYIPINNPTTTTAEYRWLVSDTDLIRIFKKIFEKILGKDIIWKIGEFLGYSFKSQIDSIGCKEGKEGIRKAYKENLELVLKYVAELLENVSGKILITSDHGEYLGENGIYGHGFKPRKSPIIEVPWLVMEKSNLERKSISEKEKIKEKIRILKKKFPNQKG